MKYTLLFLLLWSTAILAQGYRAPIDTVLWFKPGRGQTLGQDSINFPKNIFSLPDSNASANVPSSSPKDICSLGLGGEIVVGFKNFYIFDGDGPDFTIFENAFINPVTKKVFAEPAVVSVSDDGVNFYEFPWDYSTLEGCAGTNPTNGRADPFDPKTSGGNSFDLAKIGLQRVRWIKIRDICDTILQNPNHPYYDPLLSGFDLDCVVGINLSPIPMSIESNGGIYKDFFVENLVLYFKSSFIKNYEIYDMFGREIANISNFSPIQQIDFSNFDGNIFFVIFHFNEGNIILKVLKMGDAIFL